jgi:uncharacterized protein (TIGR02186 family)
MIRWRSILFSSLLAAAGNAAGQTVTADLSSHIIGITTGFAGANLVLFGSTDKPGDIVVVVRGPPTEMVVRRKEKVLGVWLNGSSATFRDAPSFYAFAATRPPAEIADPELLARHMIGIDNIRLQPTESIAPDALADFRAALMGSETRAGLYRGDPIRVAFQGQHLFRADMEFPANVPTGGYSVEVMLFADGQLSSAQTTPLIVSRIGFSNGVFAVAHHHAALYGAGALLLAVTAGWAASVAFRRV